MKKSFYLLFFTALISLLLTLHLNSQTVTRSSQEKVAEIDKLINILFERKQFNGTILVAEKGKIIYDKAFGYGNIEKQTPLKTNSCFQLASVSKQFTAMAIMMLKERKKINYEDSITKYIPELPYSGITIRHLLTHTSGLPDYMSLFRAKWDTTKSDLKDRKIAVNNDVIELLNLYHPPVYFKPGEKYEYSNTGYLLLAYIVEKVSGEEFDKFIEKNIFKPLKMKNSLIYSNIKNQPVTERAFGYQYNWDGITPVERDIGYLDGTCGDKGMYSNTEDLFKWDRALYTDKLVKKSTLKEAFTRSKLNNDSTIRYGFGWFVDTTDGKAEVWHTGTWYGFRNRFLRQIDENNTVIVLSNNTITPRTEIVQAISDILRDRTYKIPKMSIDITMGKTINEKGWDIAIKQYYELKTNEKESYNFNEDELNTLGYKLLRSKKIKESIEIFKLNTEAYPKSSNAFDSLAEAYMEDGNKDQAIINFAQSLVFNPKNISAVDNLVKLTKDSR